MESNLETGILPLAKHVKRAKLNNDLIIKNIEFLVGLVRKGNVSSLNRARHELGIPISELSNLIGVSENTLNAWEVETEIPSQKFLIAWRLKLGDFIDKKIAAYLGTSNPELIMQFWEIMWRLYDLDAPEKS